MILQFFQRKTTSTLMNIMVSALSAWRLLKKRLYSWRKQDIFCQGTTMWGKLLESTCCCESVIIGGQEGLPWRCIHSLGSPNWQSLWYYEIYNYVHCEMTGFSCFLIGMFHGKNCHKHTHLKNKVWYFVY